MLNWPPRLAAMTARGSTSMAVSTITRTTANGRLWPAATSAIPKLSMSTATAPVSRNAWALSSIRSMGCEAASSLPAVTGRRARIARRNSAHHPAEVENRAPSIDMTSPGKTTLPALKLGSRPPANPKLIRAAAPASTSLRAAIAARTPPMPPTASNAPPRRDESPSRRGAAGPKVRASASSAATTPTPFNERFRGASGCGRPPAPRAGNTPNSRDIANRRPAESRAQ